MAILRQHSEYDLMFVHKEQLAYLLSAEEYSSPEQLAVEQERIFLPRWHLVGLTSELPRQGDFKTFDLLGQSLQLRNHEGRIGAYLNVCSHRHCLLTDAPCGNSPTIKCQYHGWEYRENGQVAKVPDGGCFKPFDRENARLKQFRLETLGGLIFVSLVESPPTLSEVLGEFHDAIRDCSQPPWRHNWHWQHRYDCNWKIPVENTLETYHLPCVHEKTFGGIYPTEESQSHELNENFTTLRYQLDPNDKLVKRQQRVVRWLKGPKSTDEYIHFHVHPNLVFTFTDLYMHTQIYLPTSPTTARTEVWMFAMRGERRSLFSRILGALVARYGRKTNTVIQMEDASVFPSQQRGMALSPHPGCLGTREERLFVFQKFIRDRCGRPGDRPPAVGSETGIASPRPHLKSLQRAALSQS